MALIGVGIVLGFSDVATSSEDHGAESSFPNVAMRILDGPSRPPSPPQPRAQLLTGFVSKQLLVNGVQRRYYIQAPQGSKPVPMVIALHGLHSDPSWVVQNTGLGDSAKKSHIALVAPVMAGNAWNDGRLGRRGPDDESFILGIVKQSVDEGVADPKHITICGFSNGAEMSLVMASRYPKTFSSVVSISGELPSAAGSARPTGQIPAYFTHGTLDHIQPMNGRPSNGILFNGLLSEDETVQLFVKANHAQTTPLTTLTPQGPAAAGKLEQRVWPGGSSGAPVTYVELPGVGHKWPAPSSHPVSNDGVAAVGFDASALIIKAATVNSR